MSGPERGHTLSEFSTVTMLVGVISIGGLALLSDQLNWNLTETAKRFFSSGNQWKVSAVSSTGASPGVAGKAVTVKLANGSVVNFSQYPTDLLSAVETSGGNGATNKMLSQLDTIIKKLQKQGVDPVTVNRLKALSNAGHELAAVERTMEDAITNAASYPQAGTVGNITVDFNGNPMTVDELNKLIRWRGNTQAYKGDGHHADPLAQDSYDNMGPVTRSFMEAYYAAASDAGAMADPAVNAVVTDLSAKIVSIAGAMGCSIPSGSAVDSNPHEKLQLGMKNKASKATDLYSADICGIGSGTDSGVKCSG